MLMAREVERQAEQIVAQRIGDELVDLVAPLARHAAHDGAGSHVGCHGFAVESKGDRVEERLDQSDVVACCTSASRRSTVSVSIEWPKR